MTAAALLGDLTGLMDKDMSKRSYLGLGMIMLWWVCRVGRAWHAATGSVPVARHCSGSLLDGHLITFSLSLMEKGAKAWCAGGGADDSDRLCQQLLEVEVEDPLPDNAGQLQNLLESGKVVVTQVGSCWDCALL